MKVLCVSPSYWPAFRFGGPIYSVHTLNKAMKKSGMDISVYTTNVGQSDTIAPGLKTYVDNIEVNYFPFSKFFEFLGPTGWQFSLPLTKMLKKTIKSFDMVYIIAVWNFPIAITAYYCRKYKIPYIISPRGTLYPETTGKKSWKKMPYYKLISKRDLHGSTAIHYTTEDESEACHKYLKLKNKHFIVPNGLDLDEFRNLPSNEALQSRFPHLRNKKIILFLSRVDWKKGLDILIPAFARLVSERNDYHLLIAGNDEEGYGNQIKRQICDYGIKYMDMADITSNFDPEAHITFTGLLRGEKKLEALSGSHLFVLPSYSENFGISVVEAMASGTPVIISNKVGIYKEILDNNAGIVVETNPESLYNGLSELIDDKRKRESIISNAEIMVNNYYDISQVAKQMMDMFAKVHNGEL